MSMLTIDPPADYLLGPGDKLAVIVHGLQDNVREEKPIETQVMASGDVQMPLVGSVHVGGKNLLEAHKAITAAYADGYLETPSINVSLLEKSSVSVLVLGEVEEPGTHVLPKYENDIGHALAAAGGLSEEAEDFIEIHTHRDSMTYYSTGGMQGCEIYEAISPSSMEMEPLQYPGPENLDQRINKDETDNELEPNNPEEGASYGPETHPQLPPYQPQHVHVAYHEPIFPRGDALRPRRRMHARRRAHQANGFIVDQNLGNLPMYDQQSCASYDSSAYGGSFGGQFHTGAIRKIALRGQPYLTPEEIELQSGDVVFVPSRKHEVFYVVGRLSQTNTVRFTIGNRERELGVGFVLPRDREIDVVTAVAMAGYIDPIDSPTTVTVHRTMPNGYPLLVTVDLIAARYDPRETILVEPGDIIYLNPDKAWYFRTVVDKIIDDIITIPYGEAIRRD